MTNYSIEVRNCDDDPFSAWIWIRGLAAAAPEMGFRVTRPSAGSQRVLGPDGWQADDVLIEPDAVTTKDGAVVLRVGPVVCRYLGPGEYTLTIPAAGVSATLHWPDFSETDELEATLLQTGLLSADTTDDRADIDELSDEPPTDNGPPAGRPSPRRRMWLFPLAGFVIAGTVTGGIAFWKRQPPPAPPARVLPSVPVCQADIAERDGVVTIALTDPARRLQRATVTIDDITYTASFDVSGSLHAAGPLFHPFADIGWPDHGGAACHRQVTFPGFASAYRTALVWQGTAEMALHVGEAGAKPGDVTHYVSAWRPNNDFAAGDGEIVSFGEAAADTSRVQLYRVPADRQKAPDDPAYFVEAVSRGNPAVAPYCGDAPEARISVRLLRLSNGHPPVLGLTDITRVLEPLACGRYISRRNLVPDYYQPVSFR